MYKRNTNSILKHWDFVLLDLLCLQVAFVLSYCLRHGLSSPYAFSYYRGMAIAIEFIDLVVMMFNSTFKDVLRRGRFRELSVTVKHSVIVVVISVIYLFFVQVGRTYSRLAFLLMIPIYIAISYGTRIVLKDHLNKKYKEEGTSSKLLIVTTRDMAPAAVAHIRDSKRPGGHIVGLAVIDCDLSGSTVSDVPVVAGRDDVAGFVCRTWVDDVLIVLPEGVSAPADVTGALLETGVALHVNLDMPDDTGRKGFVERMGDYTVITYTMNYMTEAQAIIKRAMDIAGGIVGCLLCAVIFVFVAPMIYAASPGPIFFVQERIGLNGRHFKMYKFRSMYPDADERKEEFLKQNEMDGLMFKMDFDPRVIGNKVLADGTKKRGIGDFIRRTSLDEFPQFFNVLKGDMSLVGTRPPTVDEWEKYELHHKARMAVKPGITGMWQISGRSDVHDFEEVVRLDTRYINEWSLGLDIKILCKTVINVFERKGAK